MVTMVGKEMDYLKLTSHLITLEYDARAAYEAAIERLDDAEAKQKLQEFKGDHDRHLNDLKSYLTGLKQDVPDGPNAKVILTKGKVVIGSLAGDRAILMAMKTNEDDTVTAYERAITEFKNLPETLKVIVQRGHADELRHRAWIEQHIKEMKDESQSAA